MPDKIDNAITFTLPLSDEVAVGEKMAKVLRCSAKVIKMKEGNWYE